MRQHQCTWLPLEPSAARDEKEEREQLTGKISITILLHK